MNTLINVRANLRVCPNYNIGFSVRNLKFMRAFAEAYPHFPIVQVPLAQIIWRCHQSIKNG